MSPSRTESPTSTTGVVCMWNGTKDGNSAFVNHMDGSTNVKMFKIVPIKVEDVRDLPEQPTVDSSGHQLVKFTTSLPSEHFADAYSPENKRIIEDKYFDECRCLVQDVTGATEAYPYVYRIRNQSRDIKDLAESDFHNDSVPLIHVDRDPVTAPDRLRASLGVDKANALLEKYKCFGSMNVWRPIGTKVQKWPLLLINHESIPDWDYDTHMARIHFFNDKRVGTRGAKNHETILKFDPRYRYHYASEMSSDEAWLFYAFHSKPELGIPHSAFWDNSTAPDAPTRWSIEVRVWVFFDKN